MQAKGRRIQAAFGLFGLALLGATLQVLPLSIPHLKAYEEWIRAARARMRGAVLVGEGETVLQVRGNDCGAACLKMVLSARGIERSLSDLGRELSLTPNGTSLLNLRLASTRLGLPARSWIIRDSELGRVPLPAIAFINEDHFVVIRRLVAPGILEIDDPALGRLHWPIHSFRRTWCGEVLVSDPAWAPR